MSIDRDQDGLDVEGLTCERGGRALFAPLGFSVGRGRALFVTGANGTGKTTLLRALAGLAESTAGTAHWAGEPTRLGSAHWRSHCAYAGHRVGHKDELSVAENLSLACALAGVDVSAERLRAVLERVGLARRSGLLVKRLSQGQKQRLALARVSVAERPVWLLDEPSAALDTDGRELLAATLDTHLRGGGLAIVATHDRIDVGAHRSAELRLG